MVVTLTILGPERIPALVERALDLLAKVGMEIEDPAVLAFLGDHGLPLAGRRACFPAHFVERALASAPRRFSLYDRDGNQAARLGGGAVQFFPGSAALRITDRATGAAREALRADLDELAAVVQALPALPVQSTSIVPADVAAGIADRVRLFHALAGCAKPVVTGTFREDGFAPMRAMLEAVRGGPEALRSHPLAVFDCCPTAPLHWPRLTTSALRDCALAGIPAEIIPVPLTGATGPVTLEGSLVQIIAENLSGVVIHQLTAPGAPVIWGGCPMSFDMKHGTTPTGSPETALLNAASAEVAAHLGLPSHGYLGLSDARSLDLQAGFETGQGALMAALAGMNLVAGAGMLDFIGTLSLAKLVFDAEVAASVLRIRRGLAPRPGDDLPELFREALGSGGFLRMGHTRGNYREELARASGVIDRAPQAAPGQDAGSRAGAEVERILAGPRPGLLEGPRLAALREILAGETRRA